jgi:hypothetical protein
MQPVLLGATTPAARQCLVVASGQLQARVVFNEHPHKNWQEENTGRDMAPNDVGAEVGKKHQPKSLHDM